MFHPKPTDLDMTKHSDYFVSKDTSERVARHCDDTVNKKRVNSCVLKHLFLEGVEQSKISQKKNANALSDVLLMSRFQYFAADALQTKINELIRIHERPNILRSCFLHQCVRACLRVSAQFYVRVRLGVYVLMCVCVCVCVCAWVCVSVNMYVCVCVCIQVYLSLWIVIHVYKS